ncbi:MAG: thioredoxin domain-containing protein [Planctomycetaceae bacterium]
MEIRESDFEDVVLKSDRPVLVDFMASWCPPCKMMQPVVDRLAAKVADWADVYTVNIDRNAALAARFEISGVPTFVAWAGGQIAGRRTGALTEGQLLGLLKAASDAMPAPTVTETQQHEDQTVAEPRNWITIVSGLPRSGTSLMMRMLEAGGIPALTDQQRTPDEDNPNGYYEFEDVKSLEADVGWLQQAPGRSVKMVYRLLRHLPNDRSYRVLFMRRNTDEILRSQKKMLERKGITTDIPDDVMKAMFERELRNFYGWLPTQPHLALMNISYNDLLSTPAAVIGRISQFLGGDLNVNSMTSMINPDLYRQRAA